MADYSFDVVSKVDLNVVNEAVTAASKEITNRYDFKGTNSTIELNQKENELKLASADEYKVNTLRDIIFTRLAKRGIALKNLQAQKIENALGGTTKQIIKIQQGIPADKAKEITKAIKEAKFKAAASIQGTNCACPLSPRTNCKRSLPYLKVKTSEWNSNSPTTDNYEKNATCPARFMHCPLGTGTTCRKLVCVL